MNCGKIPLEAEAKTWSFSRYNWVSALYMQLIDEFAKQKAINKNHPQSKITWELTNEYEYDKLKSHQHKVNELEENSIRTFRGCLWKREGEEWKEEEKREDAHDWIE